MRALSTIARPSISKYCPPELQPCRQRSITVVAGLYVRQSWYTSSLNGSVRAGHLMIREKSLKGVCRLAFRYLSAIMGCGPGHVKLSTQSSHGSASLLKMEDDQ